MKRNKMQLKGQLRMYMRWPLIMTLLLIGMDVWMYMVDKKAGLLMSVIIIIYVGIAFSLYFYNRSLILADLIQFSVQYKGIENRLLKELAIPYAIALEDGRILWKNDCFLNLTEGQRKERYLNRMIPELHPGVFPKIDVDHVELEESYRVRCYQAELRKVSLEGFSEKEELLQIPEEQEYFVAVSLRDVTELNAYIRENEDQRMIAGLIYIDKDYRVQWEETTHLKNLVSGRHYTPGMICYRTSALRDQPCEHCAFKEAIEQKRIVRHTVRVEGVDFEVTGTPVYADDNKEVIGGLLRFEDITEKLKLDQALREAKEKAEESNRLKSAFLANMSHEIRTPLNAIVGFSDMISQIDDPEEKQEYMKIIAVNNELLLQLIDDILDLSKIEAGTMDFSYSTTDVNQLLDSICQQMNQKEHSADVKIVFTERVPECTIMTDRLRLSQVMINFISNSMKFTERGTISIGYRLDETKDEIYFFCKDTGIGIAADKIEQVFERFVKLNTFVKGTGLGLAICRVIVERLGGTIGAESEEGKGSCFWFRMPVALL